MAQAFELTGSFCSFTAAYRSNKYLRGQRPSVAEQLSYETIATEFLPFEYSTIFHFYPTRKPAPFPGTLLKGNQNALFM